VKDQRRAIVVGGGVIGCATAYYLTELEWQVRVLDAGRVGGGCSHGNCGFICPSHVMPLPQPGAIRRVMGSMFSRESAVYVKPRFDPALWWWLARFALRCRAKYVTSVARARHALLQASMPLYRELRERESIDCEWQDRGLLLVFATQEEFAEHGAIVERLRAECGVTATPYEDDALIELEPALKPGPAGGWHYTGDSHLRPDRFVSELARVLRKRGAAIEEGVDVQDIEIRTGRAVGVQTALGLLGADAVVIAAGAQSPKFAKRLACQIPIQPGKGYSITYPSTGGLPKTPLIFEETHVAVTPLETTFRVGSTMEFAGYDRSINRRRLGLLTSTAAKYLREPLGEPALEEWAGWRPMTYDDLPCIGPSKAAANVIIAAGNGMIGMASGPATGKLAAELVAGRKPHIDPAPYALDRF
jgi:D-amino-acid dehydrogenase